MQVRVRLFAVYREQAGTDALELEVPSGASAREVFATLQERFPRLRPVSEPLGVAVNREHRPPEDPLQDGDEVVFLPPVSGGQASGRRAGAAQRRARARQTAGGRFRLSPRPLDPRRLEALVAHPSCGAAVTFQGTVRSPNQGHEVLHLEYEAYGEMALQEMERIAREVAERWPEVRLAMEHRLGRAEPGEPTVCIAAAAPHRGEAFAACRYAIDTLKARVPIWKKEVWPQGEEWVRPGEHAHPAD